jgi:hypothetical protein
LGWWNAMPEQIQSEVVSHGEEFSLQQFITQGKLVTDLRWDVR